jgi:adenosylcobyric acid synthase
LVKDYFYSFSDELAGYEIHQGETELLGNANPLLEIIQRGKNEVKLQDGAISSDGKIWGSYLHGIFDNDKFRIAFVNYLRKINGLDPIDYADDYIFNNNKHQQYDLLAERLREYLDMGAIYQILFEKSG